MCGVFTGTVPVYAQSGGNPESISIRVSATVQESNDVAVVTLRDMILDRQVTNQGIVTIDPQIHDQAGKMRAEGRSNAEVRIRFLEELELRRIGGSETLTFYYVVAGNNMDDKASSEALDLDNRNFVLNSEGEFYFWIGGRVDIRNAVQGEYDGEFIVEIEYL
ncbi:MAG: hypothetical protein WD097_05660 [Balneolales bacterium]